MIERYKPYISILLLLFFTILLYIGSITFVKNSINEVIESDGENYSEYLYEEYVEKLDNAISYRGIFINNLFLGVESDTEMKSRLNHLDDNVRYRLFSSNVTEIKRSTNSEDVYTLTSDDLSMFEDEFLITKAILTSENELVIEYLIKITLGDNRYYLVLHFDNNLNTFFRIDRVPPHIQVRLVHKSGLQLHPPMELEKRRPDNPMEPAKGNHLPPPPRTQQGYPLADSRISDGRDITNPQIIHYSKEIDIIESTLYMDYFVNDVFRTYLPILWIFRITILLSFLIFLCVTIFINGGRLRAFDYNSLTHLPGNRSIVKQIERRMRIKADHMIIYCDLDNFKAFNDVYGFSSGDQIILFSAKMLKQFFSRLSGAFVGHIGGDDFVIIGEREQLTRQAEKFGREFDKTIPDFYTDTDRERGYITTKDRMGEMCEFPLISMSMGAIELRHYPSVHYLKIAEICAEVKKEAKKQPGSTLYIDKRMGLC